MPHRWIRPAIAALVGAVVLGWGGMAIAAWLATANGNSGGRAATMTFSVSASTPGSGAGDMYPSASATGSVKFSVTNPNSFAINITSVAPNGTAVSADPAACASNLVTIGTVTGINGVTVAANTTGTVTVNGVLTLSTTAPNGCQDMAFTIPLTVSATT